MKPDEDSPKTEEPKVETPKAEAPKAETPKAEAAAPKPKSKRKPKAKPLPDTFKKPETVEKAVELYNEMVLTAIDVGITHIVTVQKFVDLKTGQRACENLHREIQRARDPKPSSKKEKDDMAKKSKATAKKVTAKKTTKKNGSFVKLSDDTKITWVAKKNPFREKTGAWARTEKVREASGQTVKAMRAKKIKSNTIRTLLRMEAVKAG